MRNQLLDESKKIIEALGGDDEQLAAEVTHDALAGETPSEEAAGELPPPPADDMGELPPEAGAPEDEALGLLRDIASGIDRLANELAPVEAEAEVELEEKPPGEEKPEGEEKKEEPGVPPVEDEDEFADTMPVATGA